MDLRKLEEFSRYIETREIEHIAKSIQEQISSLERKFYNKDVLSYVIDQAYHLFVKIRPDEIESGKERFSSLLHFAVRKNNLEFVEHLLKTSNRLNPIDDRQAPQFYRDLDKQAANLIRKLQRTLNFYLRIYGEKRKPDWPSSSDIKNEIQEKLDSIYEIIKRTWTKIDVNALDRGGKTPLHYARKRDIVKLLLEHGANIEARDPDGQTPLISTINLCSIYVEALSMNMLFRNLYPEREEAVFAFVEGGADVRTRCGENQGTPLHYAESAQVAELLLGAGAEVDAKDMKGHTPLFIATCYGRLEVASVLLKSGADPNTRGHVISVTPLHIARTAKFAELLLEHGAEVDAKTDHGWTPLHYHKKCRNQQVMSRARARLYGRLEGKFSAIFDDDSSSPTGLLETDEASVISAVLLQHGSDLNVPEGVYSRIEEIPYPMVRLENTGIYVGLPDLDHLLGLLSR